MKKTFVIILVIVLLIAVGAGLFFMYTNNSKKETAKSSETTSPEENTEVVEEEPAKPVIQIFNGDARPMAFMIDNNTNAQPQSALNSAYMVYEIIVEGGETRLMALFKGATIDQVGPIRSARHYFLDYAMENDALYAHLGMSPQAQATFQEFGIQHINGQVYELGNQYSAKIYEFVDSVFERITDKNWEDESIFDGFFSIFNIFNVVYRYPFKIGCTVNI